MIGASKIATEHYFKNHSLPVSPRILGKTGWSVSPVGFGGYRLHASDPEHRLALRQALLSGCNLVDTSSNYTNGGSETLIGEVLKELFLKKNLSRDEVVIITKAGYLQGRNLKDAQIREKRDIAYPEVVKLSEDLWHCISPEFLKDQITSSLKRLNLEQLDVFLLHNPEYYLKSIDDHPEYYRRIEAAFAYLETEVTQGRIQWYGISSNTFPEASDARDFTSLEVVCEIAQRCGHHFGVIQFPFNIFEPGAALETNNSGKSVLELARTQGLGTLVNRPLNAFRGHRMVRLADFPSHAERDVAEDFKKTMRLAGELESEYPGRSKVPAAQIAWAHILRQNFEKLADLDTWKSVLAHQIRPSLTEAFEELKDQPGCPEWIDKYRAASEKLFESFTIYLESQASVESDRIAGALDHLCPDLQDSTTLSQKVIHLYRSVPGVDCILVGMRQTRYVSDILNLKAALPHLVGETARQALGELAQLE